MCIIGISPIGHRIPNEEEIKECMKFNKDGAGFMVATGDSVIIKKGFFVPSSIIEEINKTEKELGVSLKDLVFVFHSRIATHGSVCKENCHPFPISNIDDLLGAEFSKSEIGLAHNGVFSFFEIPKGKESDTYYGIKNFISMLDLNNITEEIKVFLKGVFGYSKVVILNKSGNYEKWGHWVKEDSMLWSNGSYKKYTYPTYNYNDGYNFGYEYGDDCGYGNGKWTFHNPQRNRRSYTPPKNYERNDSFSKNRTYKSGVDILKGTFSLETRPQMIFEKCYYCGTIMLSKSEIKYCNNKPTCSVCDGYFSNIKCSFCGVVNSSVSSFKGIFVCSKCFDMKKIYAKLEEMKGGKVVEITEIKNNNGREEVSFIREEPLTMYDPILDKPIRLPEDYKEFVCMFDTADRFFDTITHKMNYELYKEVYRDKIYEDMDVLKQKVKVENVLEYAKYLIKQNERETAFGRTI